MTTVAASFVERRVMEEQDVGLSCPPPVFVRSGRAVDGQAAATNAQKIPKAM